MLHSSYVSTFGPKDETYTNVKIHSLTKFPFVRYGHQTGNVLYDTDNYFSIVYK